MIIKDNLYGTIEFGDVEERVIDTPEFQRLRGIRQMSITNLVYPCANHTRFEHSLGTAHLAGQMAERLLESEEEKDCVRLYALLHDVGHVAFSHEGEDVLKEHLGTHEEVGKKIIMGSEIKDIVNENYDIRKIIGMGKNLAAIINTDIGADRMDYLKRDALNTGVAYGLIDTDRLIHTIRMEKNGLCIVEGGIEAAEWLLIARFMMFSTVYLHKTVRIATAMLHKAIENAIGEGAIMPEEFIWLGDEAALAKMRESKKASRYVDGLVKRRLYKEIASINEKKLKKQEAERVERELSEKFNCEILLDYPTQFSKPVSLRIRKKNGGLARLEDISALVASLAAAEEKRRKILVLASKENKMKYGKKIIKELGGLAE